MSYTVTSHVQLVQQQQQYISTRQRITVDAMVDKVRVQDGDDRSSESIDLSALNENETDDFGRRILAHQREKRAKQNEESRQLFPRARPRPMRPRNTEPLLTTLGATATTVIVPRPGHQRNASEGDSRLTPALNVPQEWGRRAKKREWQRRSVSDEHRIVRQDKDSIWPHTTLYTGDEHPVMSPGGVMPSVKDTPPSMTRKRMASSPNSMRHMNTTLQAGLSDGEDLEFNDTSMLASTPAAVNKRDRKVDALMKGEIETVEKQGIARRRVSEILERPGSAPSSDLASRVARRRERRLSDKENVPEAPKESVEGADRVALKKADRPSHSRNDSIALLRKLARVSSMSPSPGRDKEEGLASSRPADAPVSNVAEALRATSGKTSIARERVEARKVRINDDKARREEAAEMGSTPAPRERSLDQNHKTPVVTGAWVDTPGKPQEQRPPSQATGPTASVAQPARVSALKSSSVNNRDPRRVLSEPTHPKSALEAVVSDARTNRDSQLGDSTLASLENIVNPDLERTNSNTAEDLTRNVPSDAESLKHLTQSEKDRRQEDLALEALNRRLRSTRTTIKDASRGIRRIENQIENATEHHPNLESETQEVYEGQQLPPWPRHLKPYTQPHNSRTICEHCGGSYTSIYSALGTETREFFVTYTGPKHDKPRPTAVGWAVLAFLLWYLIENSLCDPWGYSRVAEAYYPFALPALLLKPLRWAGWMEYPVGRWVCEMLEPAMHVLFGSGLESPPVRAYVPANSGGTSGGRILESAVAGTPYSEWIQATATAVTQATTRIAASTGDALDQAGRIWNDEYLDL
ncbi:hypothetical protein Slin15195_G090840 [Septoria linicola]|uniref:Uncharacterized protein n=1 Tax=Septoria linicola TaxID=215465 RepID=A0A9Q9B097_9PEZI|nr:hypothetical protein Slin14017_G126440 [Septoria linicola]USW55765.1 hypothetical protein Slin15195_G090840 [Septoria linicola]